MEHTLFVDIAHGINSDTFFEQMKAHHLKRVFLDMEHSDDEMKDILKHVEDNHMVIDMLHLPFRPDANDLYRDTEQGEAFFERLKKGINIAIEYHIPTVVLHYGSKIPPEMNDLIIERVGILLKMCHDHHIYLCLENIRDQKRLDTLYAYFKDDEYCGICFDCGHASCFTHTLDSFPFKDYDYKIKGIHIHDNDGLHDLHQVPFTQAINYETVIKGLKVAHYEGPMILECMYNASNQNYYHNVDDYFNDIDRAYQKLDELWNNIQ